MAALLLSAAGAAAGSVFGPVGAIAGRVVGALAGGLIDNALLNRGGGIARSYEGPRLSDVEVMASTEGAPIPRLYGRARLSGRPARALISNSWFLRSTSRPTVISESAPARPVRLGAAMDSAYSRLPD